ncbi:MAG TPA: riboflavin biosynthesis protein RibF, partial [Clostridia bacterium]|nr:riboflavin biosynthesis protein RibF [Clostridia bacterium]
LLAASIVAGFDYRFGKGAKGDTQYLKEICVKFKTDVTIVDKVDFYNEPVSASRIRNLLDEGDIEKANKLLGRRYSIEGTVVHGRGLGSKIGFPTANIDISKNIKLPGSGVYLTKSSIDNELFDSITNIGSNPTINDYLTDRISCETHVIGYSSLNLYGKEIVIQFKRKIRNEQKFDSLDQLRKAIENDILLVKKQLE